MSSSHFTNNLFSTPISSSLIKVSLDACMSIGKVLVMIFLGSWRPWAEFYDDG